MASSSLTKRLLEGYEWITWEDVLETSGINMEDKGVRKVTSRDISTSLGNYKAYTPVDFEAILIHVDGCTEQTAEKFRKAFDELTQSGQKRVHIEEKCPSPSQLADESKWSQNQKCLGILCHRQPGKCHGLHVSLQVEAFATFIDDIKRGETEVESKYIEIALELMHQQSQVRSEGAIREQWTTEMVKLFPGYTVGSKKWGDAGNAQSDVTVSIGNYPLANTEIKKGFASGGDDANFENIGYYIKFQRNYQQQRAPMFLVSVVGCHYLQVFGAAWNGDSVCVDPLCSPLSLLYVPHDPNNGIKKVAHLFYALATAVDKLKNEYDKDIMQRTGPYFKMYNNIELKNMKTMAKKNRVFQATADGTSVVLKFVVGEYGLDAHNCLAMQNLAPKVLYSANLCGGWVVVVMEKIRNSVTLSSASMNKKLKASLRNAVQTLHLNNFVHGDLRPPNILALEDNTVRILDFDWAGLAGVAKYPDDLNTSVEWHEDVKRGGLIQMEHDDYQIEQILES